jgi:CIC family chloride channel protein
VKAIASAVCIGSGGSAGREGPIVQFGSALGSAVGQFLRLRPELVRTVLAAGAAGGIAATFNAPSPEWSSRSTFCCAISRPVRSR